MSAQNVGDLLTQHPEIGEQLQATLPPELLTTIAREAEVLWQRYAKVFQQYFKDGLKNLQKDALRQRLCYLDELPMSVFSWCVNKAYIEHNGPNCSQSQPGNYIATSKYWKTISAGLRFLMAILVNYLPFWLDKKYPGLGAFAGFVLTLETKQSIQNWFDGVLYRVSDYFVQKAINGKIVDPHEKAKKSGCSLFYKVYQAGKEKFNSIAAAIRKNPNKAICVLGFVGIAVVGIAVAVGAAIASPIGL